MPAPTARISSGIVVSTSDTTFSAEVVDVDPPGETNGKVDTSHQGTVTDKTFVPEDLAEPGEMKLTCHYDPEMVVPSGVKTWRIRFADGKGIQFSGFRTSITHKGPHLGKMVSDVTIQRSGSVSTYNATGSGSGTGSGA